MSSPRFVSLGPGIVDDLGAGLDREWLLANGRGGYAMGTLAGVPTRSYHGWLVAALEPPVGRTVLVGGLDAWAVDGQGRRHGLSAFEFADGTLAPQGWRLASAFELEGNLPVWRFAVGDSLVERSAWMIHGANTTFVRHRLLDGPPLDLELRPLITCRDHHALTSGHGWAPAVHAGAEGVAATFGTGGPTLRMAADGATFDPGGAAWWWGFRYRAETARGLPDLGDLYCPGAFRGHLTRARPLDLAFSAEQDFTFGRGAGSRALRGERTRQAGLVARCGEAATDPLITQLILAADQFVVTREAPGVAAGSGRSVIAGYPWFDDWGRDAMISLPGLLLASGRPDDAAAVLRVFAAYVRDGLVPNAFPGRADAEPGYGTVDAGPWFVLAVAAHAAASGSPTVAAELRPAWQAILDGYLEGTLFGIGVDPTDGLLRAGQEGLALTWMDARIGGVPITPRMGKPVELQAIFWAALSWAAAWLATEDPAAATRYGQAAARLAASFEARFLPSAGAGSGAPGAALAGSDGPSLPRLFDVVDGPSGDDPSLRPNELLALALGPVPGGDGATSILAQVETRLLTGLALRTLDPADPAYRPHYGGDQASRDSAYHQGSGWPWLIGPYLDAFARVGGQAVRGPAFDAWRATLEAHLGEAGLGSISELTDGDPPFVPAGCPFQAWSVAEALRVLLGGRLAPAPTPQRGSPRK